MKKLLITLFLLVISSPAHAVFTWQWTGSYQANPPRTTTANFHDFSAGDSTTYETYSDYNLGGITGIIDTGTCPVNAVHQIKAKVTADATGSWVAEYSNNGTAWTSLGSQTGTANTWTPLIWTLSTNQYARYYRVGVSGVHFARIGDLRIFDASGSEITTASVVPSAPAGLSATPGNATVTLSWTASSGAASYNVKRGTVSGSGYAAVSSPTTNSFVNTGLTNGVTYYYVVSSVNCAGESANSGQVSATPVGPPSAPTGLSAIPGVAQVALNWSAASGATAYNVKRATVSGGGYATVTSPASPGYGNTGLTNGTTYYYVVSAFNAGGESANSSEVSTTPFSCPAGLTATPGNAQVALIWNALSGVTSYNVKHATISGGPYTTVASPASNSYTDVSLINGVAYFYVVSGVNSLGESGNSSQASATPVLPVPTGLTATAGDTQVSLTWNSVSGATRYNVKHSTIDGGPYTIVGNPSTASYTDINLTDGLVYYYVVSAVDGNSQGANSAQVSASPQVPAPPTPTGLTATPGAERVSLTWNASPGATSYSVIGTQGSNQFGSPPLTYVVNGLTAASYIDTHLIDGLTYAYSVSACNAGGCSANTGEVAATPTAAPWVPTGLMATAGSQRITLTWDALPLYIPDGYYPVATSFNVKRSTMSGGPYTTIFSPTTASYTDNSVTNGIAYYYVVSGVNAGGESGDSGQVSATPFDFSLSALPASVTILKGGRNTATVSITGSAGFTGNVSLSVTGLPSGTTAAFDTNPAGALSVLTLSSTSTATVGTSTITVTGVWGSLSRTATISLVVATPQLVSLTLDKSMVAGGTTAQGTVTLNGPAPSTGISVSLSSNNVVATVQSQVVIAADQTSAAFSIATSAISIPVSARITAAYGSSSLVQSLFMYPLIRPMGLNAKAISSSEIALDWGATFGATSYKVERSADGNTNWTQIATSTATAYHDTGLAPATRYYYRVRATDDDADSGYSNIASAVTNPAPPQTPTIPSAPSNLVATGGDATAALTWTPVSGATSYNVSKGIKTGGRYEQIASGVATATYTDQTVWNNRTYYYVVTAVNSAGESGHSNEASVTPNPSDGSYPAAGVIQGGDGILYGSTSAGGVFNNGTLFKIDSTGVFTNLYSFTALDPYGVNADGANPAAQLLLGSNGHLYGGSAIGGTAGTGTIFTFDLAGNLAALPAIGSSHLILGANGYLYGTSQYGGTNENGCVFRMDLSGGITVLYSFTPFVGFSDNTDGAQPASGVIQGSDGSLYGTTPLGGASGTGTVYKLDSLGNFTLLHEFGPIDGNGINADGTNPGTMVQTADGTLYGTTKEGGVNDTGTVFKIGVDGLFTSLYSFGPNDITTVSNTDGANPGNLVIGTDSHLYGITELGGANDYGTFFTLPPDGTVSTLHSFSYYDGINPQGQLILGQDGKFYGTTSNGGGFGQGTVFKIDTSGTVTVLKSFHSKDNNDGF